MKRELSIVFFVFMLFTATTGGAMEPINSMALKEWKIVFLPMLSLKDVSERYLNYDCTTEKSCIEYINSNKQPANPELKVNIINVGTNTYVIAGCMKRALGHKAAIEVLNGGGVKKSVEVLNGAKEKENGTQYYIYLEIDFDNSTRHAFGDKTTINAKVWTVNLYKTFSEKVIVSDDMNLRDRVWQVLKASNKVSEEVVKWIEEEQSIAQKKSNLQKNAEAKGK
ncbi:MAG: hypothetical protein M1510_09690 [Nitrospirae bacterium]|nr:hypothetical protein [Nitrospirota bacterium]MCL5237052.1 hypothetical protein [Nitrospirota bacterium]